MTARAAQYKICKRKVAMQLRIPRWAISHLCIGQWQMTGCLLPSSLHLFFLNRIIPKFFNSTTEKGGKKGRYTSFATRTPFQVNFLRDHKEKCCYLLSKSIWVFRNTKRGRWDGERNFTPWWIHIPHLSNLDINDGSLDVKLYFVFFLILFVLNQLKWRVKSYAGSTTTSVQMRKEKVSHVANLI